MMRSELRAVCGVAIFPPVAGREGYRNALQWTMEHTAFLSEGDKEWLFGKTALFLFKFAC